MLYGSDTSPATLPVTTRVLPPSPLGAASPSFAFWFIALTLVTSFGALGALAQNLGVFTVLATLSAGSALTAAGFYAGSLVRCGPGAGCSWSRRPSPSDSLRLLSWPITVPAGAYAR